MISLPLLDLVDAVRRNGIDIRSVPLAGLLRPALAAADFEIRSRNTLLAATLIQLKIDQLLPTPPYPAIEPVPDQLSAPPKSFDREQLNQAAAYLGDRAGIVRTHPAGQDETGNPGPVPPGLNLLDVVQLARKALETARAYQEIDAATPTLVRIEDMIQVLEDALAGTPAGIIGFDQLLEAQPDATRRVSLFLAVLELVRLARLRIEQDELFSAISLCRSDFMAL